MEYTKVPGGIGLHKLKLKGEKGADFADYPDLKKKRKF